MHYITLYFISLCFIIIHCDFFCDFFLYSFCAILSSPNKSTSGQLFFYKVTLSNGNPELQSSKPILLGPNKRYMQID